MRTHDLRAVYAAQSTSLRLSLWSLLPGGLTLSEFSSQKISILMLAFARLQHGAWWLRREAASRAFE